MEHKKNLNLAAGRLAQIPKRRTDDGPERRRKATSYGTERLGITLDGEGDGRPPQEAPAEARVAPPPHSSEPPVVLAAVESPGKGGFLSALPEALGRLLSSGVKTLRACASRPSVWITALGGVAAVVLAWALWTGGDNDGRSAALLPPRRSMAAVPPAVPTRPGPVRPDPGNTAKPDPGNTAKPDPGDTAGAPSSADANGPSRPATVNGHHMPPVIVIEPEDANAAKPGPEPVQVTSRPADGQPQSAPGGQAPQPGTATGPRVSLTSAVSSLLARLRKAAAARPAPGPKAPRRVATSQPAAADANASEPPAASGSKPDTQAKGAEPAPPAPQYIPCPPGIRFSGAIRLPNGLFANLNGKFVRVGGRVGNAKVVKITNSSVEMELPGNKRFFVGYGVQRQPLRTPAPEPQNAPAESSEGAGATTQPAAAE